MKIRAAETGETDYHIFHLGFGVKLALASASVSESFHVMPMTAYGHAQQRLRCPSANVPTDSENDDGSDSLKLIAVLNTTKLHEKNVLYCNHILFVYK
ncbi:hypothetical protein AVEN_80804-1 [Araneus ventricosus]|uniref:Uncharacterized protein n=1 Tax=Araneus ventricosus TaxID=182803 RepID=A0A4Y2FIG5_ARAVE|nr:hypothetical protein AVEN_80804-1 [Araneus ventricosus]